MASIVPESVAYGKSMKLSKCQPILNHPKSGNDFFDATCAAKHSLNSSYGNHPESWSDHHFLPADSRTAGCED